MKLEIALFAAFVAAVAAHGGHGDDEPHHDGETAKEYALRHMATEHHIDAFDLKSFFALHDLDGNGYLDASEIEAIYGVHHTESQKKSKDEAAHAEKAKRIVREVLAKMDTNRDGVLSQEEFEAAGMEGLPDFSSLGAEGHHYDEESEFFLHHEETHHSTPETQTDESYNHPEDIAHFQNHEKIELAEENKERVFQGLPKLTEEEARAMHSESGHHDEPPTSPLEDPVENIDKEKEFPSSPKFIRPKKGNANEIFKGMIKEAKEQPEYGTGEQGFKRPKTAADKLRRGAPYKYKFRRNWGDF